MSDLSKLDTLLHKTNLKVVRPDMCRSIILLSKITHQMWRDHTFCQRNKTTEGVVGVGLGGDRGSGAVGQSLKKEGVGNIGGSS